MLARLLAVALAGLISACDNVGVKGLSDGQLAFEGVQRVDWRSDGKYVLVWSPGPAEVQYLVYMLDLGEVEVQASGSILPVEVGQGPRLAFRSPQDANVSPEKEGKLLATLGGDQASYDIKTQFLPTHSYAFQVKMRGSDGAVDGNSAVLYLTINTNATYLGCLRVESTNSTSINIDVEYPQGASEVRIFRDDILVKKVDTPSSTTVVDDGLKAGRTYTYRCEAQVGNDTWVGSEQPSAQPYNAFGKYEGCLEGVLDGYNVKIKYAFPEEADQVVIYRNGLQVYSSRSAAGNAFVDQNLAPGEPYIYTCEVQKGAMAVVGLKKLDVIIPDALASFDGCVDATALGASQIRVDFSFPKGADKITVFRNGVQIYNTINKGETSFIDTGLTEGQSYQYTCGAKAGIFEKIGTQQFDVSTLSTNPPTFAGIKKVEILSPSSVQVEWGVADLKGVSAAYYQIYSTVGTIVEWGAPPSKTINAGVLKATLTELGDELPYAFGVRACSSQNICDTNTVSLRKTMQDGGAPTTIGAISAAIVNGEVQISAPWQPKNGAVQKRRVYRRSGPTGGLNIADYALASTITVDNLAVPPTTLTIGNILENTTYHFMVLDEDPTGHLASPQGSVSLTTGDLTPPSFTGISGLLKGVAGKEATSLRAEFTASTTESPANPGGASQYLLLVKEGGGDACANGVLKMEFPASSFVDGDINQIEINGLFEKTYYSVCLKAKDSSGNISKVTTFLQRYTQDLTVPVFDGVQYASYNFGTGKIDVVWNPASSPDIVDYRVQIWKNTGAPAPNEISTFVKQHNAYASGFSFAATEFSFIGNDQIHILVNACDNAHLIPDGVQNCTTLSLPFSYTVPDVTPPQGFLGVEGSVVMQTPSEGVVDVYWKAPQGGDWTDYRGFKIYTVDQNNPPIGDDDLIFVKDCPCSGNNCPNEIVTCQVLGLTPYRTYNFHVRAYDANGNITNYLSPAVYTTAKRTIDQTAPQFSSNLTATYISEGGARIALAWTAAADNQYAQEPGVSLTYKVWRREGVTFSDVFNPGSDGDATELSSQTTINYDDTALSSNIAYYYTICAVDASNNRNCDGVVRSVLTPDVEPPVLSAITSTKETSPDDKQWDLTWTMTDNSDLNTVRVTIKAAFSTEATAPDMDALYTQTVVEADGIQAFNDLTGPADTDTYIHYMIIARDLAGNSAKNTYSVYSQNRVEVTSVTRANGTTAGGRLIVIQGSGFAAGATVRIGLQDCLNVQVYRSSAVGCITPAQSAGSYTVSVTNPADTGSSSLPNGYTYIDPSDPAADLCDLAGSQSTSAYAGGTGASGTPYLICNGSQLNLVRNENSGKYFKLRDNINLSGFTNNSFSPIKSANYASEFYNSQFDGNNLFVVNWTYKSPAESNVGFFKRFASSSLVKNLHIANADIEGLSNVGIMVGYANRGNCTAILTDISVQGKVRSNKDMAGGLAGYIVSGSVANASVTATISGYSAPGSTPHYYYVGGFAGRADTCTFSNVSVKAAISGDHYYMGGLAGYTSRGIWTNAKFDGSITRDSNVRNQMGGAFGVMTAGSASDLSQKSQLLNSQINVKMSGPNTSYVGGLVGLMYHTSIIEDTTVTGIIKGSGMVGGAVGGFAANVNTQIRRTKVDAAVIGSSSSIGGFIGGLYWHSTSGLNGVFVLENNGVAGSVTGTSYVGGFFGEMNNCSGAAAVCNGSIIRKNYSTAAVYGSQAGVGGFAGMFRALTGKVTVTQNYASGAVVGDNSCVGGFAGYWGADISDSYARGQVTGVDYAGGFIGCPYSHQTDFSPTFRRIYATGKVVKGLGTKYGGLFGWQVNATANPMPYNYEAGFWDKTTTGLETSAGDASQIAGKATAEMKNSATYTTATWDFTPITGVWKIPSGGGYPVFLWQ